MKNDVVWKSRMLLSNLWDVHDRIRDRRRLLLRQQQLLVTVLPNCHSHQFHHQSNHHSTVLLPVVDMPSALLRPKQQLLIIQAYVDR